MSFGLLYYFGLSIVAVTLSAYVGFLPALLLTVILALAPALAWRKGGAGDDDRTSGRV